MDGQNTNKGTIRYKNPVYSEICSEVLPQPIRQLPAENGQLHADKGTDIIEDEKTKSRLPILKHAADKIIAERRGSIENGKRHEVSSREYLRRSSIPKLIKEKQLPEENTKTNDKLNEIINQIASEPIDPEIVEKVLDINNEDSDKVDSKFEEIVHNYGDEIVKPISVEKEKSSKIPLLKGKSITEATQKRRPSLKRSISENIPQETSPQSIHKQDSIKPLTHKNKTRENGEFSTNNTSEETINDDLTKKNEINTEKQSGESNASSKNTKLSILIPDKKYLGVVKRHSKTPPPTPVVEDENNAGSLQSTGKLPLTDKDVEDETLLKVNKDSNSYVPKKNSILTKIALFENQETRDPSLTFRSPRFRSKQKKQDDNEVPEVKAINNLINDFPTEKSKSRDEIAFIGNDESKNKAKAEEDNGTSSKTQIDDKILNENCETKYEKDQKLSEIQADKEKTNVDINKTEIKDNYTEPNVLQNDIAELEAKSKVKEIVIRLNSVEKTERQTSVSVKNIQIKKSVKDRIALFENKVPEQLTKSFSSSTKYRTSKAFIKKLSEEEYAKAIEDLNLAREKYGSLSEKYGDIVQSKTTLNNGIDMPNLALGTALVDPKLLPHVIRAAIDLGYRGIDTAYVDGYEREIGQAIRDKIDDGAVSRSDLFITNKLWSTFYRPELVEVACRNSLEAMGLEYFDLYLLHNPMSFKEGNNPFPTIAGVIQYSSYDYLDAWFAMEALVKKGLVRSIGVSNFNAGQVARLWEKAKIKPVVNQVESHPYLTQEGLDEVCSALGIKLQCFGILGSPGTPNDLKGSRLVALNDPEIQALAEELAIPVAGLLVRYQLDNGRAVVVKASTVDHLQENLTALTYDPLTSDYLQKLASFNRNKRTYTFKGMGDTHKNYPFISY